MNHTRDRAYNNSVKIMELNKKLEELSNKMDVLISEQHERYIKWIDKVYKLSDEELVFKYKKYLKTKNKNYQHIKDRIKYMEQSIQNRNPLLKEDNSNLGG